MADAAIRKWPLIRPVLDFALPPRCPSCGVIVADDHEFCGSCWVGLTFLSPPECSGCGLPFEIDPGEDTLCPICLANTPALDGVRAAVAYGPGSREAILKLKHGRRPMIAHLVAAQLQRRMEGLEQAVLLPVPLHRWRIWSRGYNQSALIAEALASRNRQQVLTDALVRTKATPPMGHFAAGKRRRLLNDAFSINPIRKDQVEGCDIVLIDDVYTTGATANGCAKILKQAGARRVTLLCWARVVETLR